MASRTVVLLPGLAKAFREPHWQPSADVYECRHGWLVKVELAGVTPDDVEITIEGRRLTIRGTRRDCVVERGNRSHLMEIAYNRFERSIEMPCPLDEMHVSLESREGMLLVRLEKADESL